MSIEAGLPLHVGGEVEQTFFHRTGLHAQRGVHPRTQAIDLGCPLHGVGEIV